MDTPPTFNFNGQVYTLQRGNAVNVDDYINAFNQAYQGYYVPILLTRPAFNALLVRESIDLSVSIAAVQDDTVVGTSLMGVREPEGWIGGVGVVPDHRRRGIARHMMTYQITLAQERGLARLILEVIEDNTNAYNLYADLDFVPQRRLSVLRRDGAPPIDTRDYIISSAPPLLLLTTYYRAFHDTPNPWQRRQPALRELAPNLDGWTIAHHDDPDTVLGYTIGWITDDRGYLLDIATDPTLPQRDDILRALVSMIHQTFAESALQITNLPENDAAYAPLRALGYEETLAQYEMHKTL